MFHNAESFDGDVSKWDVSYVTDMFSSETSFNNNISMWKVSRVFTMDRMFYGATSFNAETVCLPHLQDIGMLAACTRHLHAHRMCKTTA
jgi:surface protein